MILAFQTVRLYYFSFYLTDGGVLATGMFLDNAQDLVFQPKLTDDDLMRRFSVAVQDVVTLGLTSVHDAGLDPISLKFFAKCVRVVKITKHLICFQDGRPQ